MRTNSRKNLSKKTRWILAITAIAMVGLGIWCYVHFRADLSTEAPEVTDMVIRQTMDTTYTANGTLALKNQKAENAMTDTSAGYRVKEVNVEVGDAVKTGDVLYTLDMSDVETQQSVTKQKLANIKAQNDLAAKAASRDLCSAKAAQAQIANDSAEAVNAAQASVSRAKNALSDAEKELDAAKQEEQKEYEKLNSPEPSLQETDDPAPSSQVGEAELQNRYETAVERRKTAQETVKTAQAALDAASASLREASSAAKANNRAAADDVASKQDAVANQNLTNQTSVADQQAEIRKNEEILKNGVVKATMDGTVTEVNVAAGAVYAGDRAVMIGDLDHLMILVEVESAHIPDIQQGMTAEFTTDATREEVLSGLVTFVSPVPSFGTQTTATNPDGTSSVAPAAVDPSSSGSKVTHRVEISLGETNERLRIGMKAKVNFILERIPDVLCVTTMAIQYDEDGNPYLSIQNPESGETKRVIIETGASNDSFTEVISDEVHEDDVVVYSSMVSGEETDEDALEGIFYG